MSLRLTIGIVVARHGTKRGKTLNPPASCQFSSTRSRADGHLGAFSRTDSLRNPGPPKHVKKKKKNLDTTVQIQDDHSVINAITVAKNTSTKTSHVSQGGTLPSPAKFLPGQRPAWLASVHNKPVYQLATE